MQISRISGGISGGTFYDPRVVNVFTDFLRDVGDQHHAVPCIVPCRQCLRSRADIIRESVPLRFGQCIPLSLRHRHPRPRGAGRRCRWIWHPDHIARTVIRRRRPCRADGIRDARDYGQSRQHMGLLNPIAKITTFLSAAEWIHAGRMLSDSCRISMLFLVG